MSVYTRQEIDERAAELFAFLDRTAPTGYTIHELTQRFGLPRNDMRRVIRRTRDIADDHGKLIPNAVPGTGFVYRVATEAVHAYIPLMHAIRIWHGLERRRAENARAHERMRRPGEPHYSEMYFADRNP